MTLDPDEESALSEAELDALHWHQEQIARLQLAACNRRRELAKARFKQAKRAARQHHRR